MGVDFLDLARLARYWRRLLPAELRFTFQRWIIREMANQALAPGLRHCRKKISSVQHEQAAKNCLGLLGGVQSTIQMDFQLHLYREGRLPISPVPFEFRCGELLIQE